MKILKKLAYVVLIFIASLLIYAVPVKAATLTITADDLNLRKTASTSSSILAMISKGEECEIIEKQGDWYKVKYKSYTGYVSKDYVKVNSEQKVQDNDTLSSDEQDTVGKIKSKTDVKLLPLIYSSNISTLNKNAEVTVIEELNQWTYIQTDTIAGWIRKDLITKSNSNTNSDENNSSNKIVVSEQEQEPEQKQEQTNNETYEEKTMYINDSFVNIRKEPNTSSKIIMTVELNTKLTVIGEDGDWYKVKTSEGNAYVLKELLSSKKVNEVTTRGQVNINNAVKVSSSTKGTEVVQYAKTFLGVPYVYGGASPSGFDCSGFTMYVYKKFGISMSHGAQSQSKIGKAITTNKKSASDIKQKLQPGDLVFFLDYETMDEIGHCGIYIGDGKFIHASSGSSYMCVKIDSLLPGEYYNTRYCAARRII